MHGINYFHPSHHIVYNWVERQRVNIVMMDFGPYLLVCAYCWQQRLMFEELHNKDEESTPAIRGAKASVV